MADFGSSSSEPLGNKDGQLLREDTFSGYLYIRIPNGEYEEFRDTLIRLQNTYFPEVNFTHHASIVPKESVDLIWFRFDKYFLIESDNQQLWMGVFSENESEYDLLASPFYFCVNPLHYFAEELFSFRVSIKYGYSADAHLKLLQLFDEVASSYTMYSGYVHDSLDMLRQDQISPFWFEMFDQPLDRKRLFFSKTMNRDLVDLEKNPCHQHRFEPYFLRAAWVVYLGEDSIKLLFGDKPYSSDLQDFQVTRVGVNAIRVNLGESPQSCKETNSSEIFWRFREASNLDRIAHKFDPPENQWGK